jgi:hypothetical protein
MKTKFTFIDRLDVFAIDVPHFNIDGLTKISTFVGLSFSTFLFVIMLGFSTGRVITLMNQESPQIATFEIDDYYSMTDRVELEEHGF